MNQIHAQAGGPFDAIVIGTGAGGSAAASRLAAAGLQVLVIEKGERLPRDGSTLDVRRVITDGAFKSREPWMTGDYQKVVPEEHFNVGGKTKWYGAALLRFAPGDFEADVEHQCPAWPIRGSELAPYYDQAEAALGLTTFEVEPSLTELLRRLEVTGSGWMRLPLYLGLSPAILDDPREASHFDGFASPAGLKADAERAFLASVYKSPNVRMLEGAAVSELLAGPSTPTEITGVRLADGRTARARAVLLAAGALHSPRLLQRYLERHALSWLPMAPNVGRHLKLHLLTAVLALALRPQQDLLRKTALLVHPYVPHSSVQPLGFDATLLANLIPAYVPRSVARSLGQRAYGFFLQTEDGSHYDNRVIDAGAPGNPTTYPVLDYDATRLPVAEREHRRLVSLFRRALYRAGYVTAARRIGLAGTAHACGTLMAGQDPRVSVVDGDGKVHGTNGLYVVDGSVLPRVSRVNPALTIYAWGLRTADRLATRLHTPAYARRTEERSP